jgi:hypothetical protein
MLPKDKRQELLAAIEPLREKVDHWRKTRTVNEHMPEPLWVEATQLAKLYGVAAVQGILRIDYRGLKRRAVGLPAALPAPKSPPRFVELPSLAIATRRVEHTVELEDGAGRRLTVKVADGNLAEVLAFVQTFWRA